MSQAFEERLKKEMERDPSMGFRIGLNRAYIKRLSNKNLKKEHAYMKTKQRPEFGSCLTDVENILYKKDVEAEMIARSYPL